MKDIHRAGQSHSTRRSFVQLATASALLTGGAPGASWSQSLQANIRSLVDPPNFDGRLLFDEATRRSAAADNGGHVRRLPIAVLKAQSVDDVIRIVAYTNKHGLKIAMRGQGHSQYGQSQVEAGIVIDSSLLKPCAGIGTTPLMPNPAPYGAMWRK
jgi:hypothetical protein